MARARKLSDKKRRQKFEKEAQKKSNRKRRSLWVRRWLARRPSLGQYARLIKELQKEDVKGFKYFLRVDYDIYQEILQRIEGRIKKQDTNYRKAVSPGLKLAISLRYLAAGDNYHSLMYGDFNL